MLELKEDIQFAVACAIKKPAINLLILFTFALGIGANSAIFSVVYHVLFAPLPYADGDRLVRLQQHQPLAQNSDIGSSVPSFFDIRNLSNELENLVEYHSMQFTLLSSNSSGNNNGKGIDSNTDKGGEVGNNTASTQQPQRVQTGVVSANYFKMLGITPTLGRDFRADEDQLGAEPLILLSHEYWDSQFARNPNVVGMSLEMNNATHKVIGVLPPFPAYPNANDIYITAASCPFRSSEGMITNRRMGMLTLFGKLNKNSSIEKGNTELVTIAQQLAQTYPDDYPENQGFSANLISMKDEMIGDSAQTFYLLLIISALVLLIACANVANLNIAKLAGRAQEIAIREALGATPGRIARQLLTESTTFALIGGILGLFFAWPVLFLLKEFALDYSPLASEISMDTSVLLFSFLVSVIAGLFSGGVSLFNRKNINHALKEGGDKVTASATGLRWRNSLLATQIGLSFIILCVAALVSLSLYRLTNQDAGFTTDNILSVNLDLNFSNYTNNQQRRDFALTLLNDVQALPEVETASVSGSFPLSGNLLGPVPFEAETLELNSDDVRPRATVTIVSEAYHQLLEIPLLEGRYFSPLDDENAPSVVLVNQTLANTYFPDGNVLGQRLSADNGQNWSEIIGIVADVRSLGLDVVSQDAYYLPFRQNPLGRVRILAKTQTNPMSLRQPIVSLVHDLDPQQAIASSQTLQQVKEQWLSSPRLIRNLVGTFGILALFITISGVVGVMAYNISQRSKEIGIRMSVGATPSEILQQLLFQASKITLTGIALGLIMMPVIAPNLDEFLYATASGDVTIYLLTTCILILAAIVATYFPAQKATRINPANALREE